jgi:hypothetical protein
MSVQPENYWDATEAQIKTSEKQDREAAREVSAQNLDRDAEPFGSIPKQRKKPA